MSMIYECPNCHAPQSAGGTACRTCGAEFDGPVPDDAVLPETPPTPPMEASPGEAGLEPAAPAPTPSPNGETPAPPSAPPPLERVLPPQPEALPYQSPPSPPPPYVPMYPTSSPPTMGGSGPTLPRVLLIATPIVLVLVLGGVFFAHSLDSGAVPAAPVPAVPAAAPAPRRAPPPTPVGSPVTLPGSTASTGDSAAGAWLVGRWQARTSDFYVFNGDHTGSRGTLTGKQASLSFVWVVVQNQLVLYADKKQNLAFSPGPDDGTLYLRGDDNRYVQYSRAKDNG